MVYLRPLMTFAGTASCIAGLALAGENGGRRGPFKRSGLSLKVLTGAARNACSDQQVTALKSHLEESVDLAEAGSKALKVEGVETSDAFTSFLGNADPKQMDAQHYAPIASLRPVNLQSVNSDAGHSPGKPATAGEMLFFCFPAKGDPCFKSNGEANGLVAQAAIPDETVGLCPLFFQKTTKTNSWTGKKYTIEPLSLAAAKAPYLAGKLDEIANPIPGRTLFHEFQHLRSTVGEHWMGDLYIKLNTPTVVVPKPAKPEAGVIGVFFSEHCMGIPADKKCRNAQNAAYFALDVWADPARGRPKTSSSGSSPKTPKRFEASYLRRAEKAAAADPGAKDTSKRATGGTPADKANPGTEKPKEKAVSVYKRPKLGPFPDVPTISDVKGAYSRN